MATGIGETNVEAVTEHDLDGIGDDDGAGIRKTFEPCRHIDAVTEYGAVRLLANVTQVQADAKPHAPLIGHRLIHLCQPLLDGH